MIELAPPSIGEYAVNKNAKLKNIRQIVSDCISEIPQVHFLKVNVKIKKFNTIEKIIYNINKRNVFPQKIKVILHIGIGYDHIVPAIAETIQEKIINTLKIMTDYENIHVDIFVKK